MSYELRDLEKKYFILLEDTDGHERKKKYIPNIFHKVDEIYKAIKGDIFEKDSSKKNNEYTTEIKFVSAENPDRSITCVIDKLKYLESHEYNLLIAAVSCNDRMQLHNSSIFEEIKTIEIGDYVSVDVYNDRGTRTMDGKVCYMGLIKEKMGYHFGIKLMVRI